MLLIPTVKTGDWRILEELIPLIATRWIMLELISTSKSIFAFASAGRGGSAGWIGDQRSGARASSLFLCSVHGAFAHNLMAGSEKPSASAAPPGPGLHAGARGR